MKDETTNSYELTLTPNYVSDWNFNDALRELIQNGTDQEVLDPDNEFQIDYSPKEKVLRLKNRKSVLKINTLLLGRSSKANNEDTVGQFGEGYKIAALVLNRLGKTFTIYNNEKNEVWESRFKNSEKWLEKILCFYVSKRKTDDHGLCIEVGNVTQGEFNDLYKVWLHLDDCDYSKAETKYGEIILDEAYAGEVYVNGLFVDCNSDLKYGYNFKPKYIRLERDRKTCDTWNVEDTTSLMIAEAMVKGDIPMEKVRRMVEERADDVYHFEFNAYKDDVKKVQEMLIESFDTQNPQPYSVPVDSQEDIRKVKAYGGNPVVVPAGVAKLLKEEKDKRIKTLTEIPWALPVKGSNNPMLSHFKLSKINKQGSQAYGMNLVLVDGDKYKDMIAGRMKKPNGRGSWMVFDGCDREYAEQVTAEHKVNVKSGNRTVQRWVPKRSHIDNHYLDAEVYALAAADISGVRTLHLQDEAEAKAKAERPEEAYAPEETWIKQNENWI